MTCSKVVKLKTDKFSIFSSLSHKLSYLFESNPYYNQYLLFPLIVIKELLNLKKNVILFQYPKIKFY